MIAVGRYRWKDLVHGKKSVDISVYKEDSGLVKGIVDGEVMFECTTLELRLLFAMISRFLGKKESRKLINIKKDKTERWTK